MRYLWPCPGAADRQGIMLCARACRPVQWSRRWGHCNQAASVRAKQFLIFLVSLYLSRSRLAAAEAGSELLAPPSEPVLDSLLMEEAEPEAEDLLAIMRSLDDWEAKVQSDRHWAQHRYHEAEADARRDAIILDIHPTF